MNILFLIRTLNPAGAEGQLVNLAKGLKFKGHKVSVAVLYAGGFLEGDLTKAGIPVFSLEKKYRWDIFSFFLSFYKIKKKLNPQLIHSYGGIPNCLVVIMKLLSFDFKAVWGVRASFLDLSQYDSFVRWAYKLECMLSRFADLIIANSEAGRKYALLNGFPADKMEVVYNGINTTLFAPNQEARIRVRCEWNVATSTILVGFVGRLDPMKDHPVFIDAMARVIKEKNNIFVVCVGGGSEEYLSQLKGKVELLGIANNFLWEDARYDVPDCMNAFDVFVSSSYGEGFPNVIGEAMACGTPCVVTDVGDSAYVVGDCGIVVPPSDSVALSSAIICMKEKLSNNREELAAQARKRIVDHFTIDNLINNSEKYLNELLAKS